MASFLSPTSQTNTVKHQALSWCRPQNLLLAAEWVKTSLLWFTPVTGFFLSWTHLASYSGRGGSSCSRNSTVSHSYSSSAWWRFQNSRNRVTTARTRGVVKKHACSDRSQWLCSMWRLRLTPDRHENCKHQRSKVIKNAKILKTQEESKQAGHSRPRPAQTQTQTRGKEAPPTFEASQVLFNLQKLQNLSHCGHITICPPISGSHTSLLRNVGRRVRQAKRLRGDRGVWNATHLHVLVSWVLYP